MRRLFTLLLSLTFTLLAQVAYGQCSEPFFSEYLEGSGNNKSYEIYNPTGAAIDLAGLKVYRFNNGATTANDSLVFPTGTMVMAGDVYVIANPSADAAILAEADTTHSTTFYNGNDALILVDTTTNDTLDAIGEVGVDPGSTGWAVGSGFTRENTLVRMASVEQGTTDWTVGATQWLVFAQDSLDFVGGHTSNCAAIGSGCTTPPFFSEYLEGSSNNKSYEIYNPTGAAIDLAGLKVYRFNNGATTANDSLVFPTGTMVMAGDVYVIANPSADAAILAEADTTHSTTFYNGNDALILVDTTTNDTLDAIGEVGVDPGSTGWAVGSGFTRENTLVRMASVNEGIADWTIGATQWLVFPQNEFDSLGAHVMTPCSTDPTLSFVPTTLSVNETAGTISFDISLANAPTDTVAVDVMLAGSSTAMSGMDFTWNDTTVDFPANATMNLTLDLDIIDDADPEMAETIVLKLMNPTNGALLGMPDSLVITILENDAIIPVYDIALITADADGDGQADSLGVECEIRGVVYGVDLQGSPNNVAFTVIDSTGGMGVASFGNTFGYTVTEGDSVRIIGTVGEFNALAQMEPLDTIIFESAGNPLVAPAVVDSLGEYTESELIRINNVFLADASQWPAAGDNANVDIVVNGTDTLTLRIDRDTDLDGSPAPTGLFDVIGLGGQFDGGSPATGGYQILPRSTADIIPVDAPGFSFAPSFIEANEGDGMITFEVSLANAFPNATSVNVALGAGSTATDGADFTGWNDTMLTFPAGSTGPFQLSLMLNDDTDVEGEEEIVLELSMATGGPVLGDSVLTIVIEDNDYTPYDIGLVTADSDGDGLADSIGTRCEIRGVVHSTDFRGGDGIEFVIIDSTGGITVFEFDDVSGFGSSATTEISQGDEFVIRGRIDQFRGLAQMRPDTLIRVSTGNTPFEPMLVNTLDETTESEYLRLECFKLVEPSNWPINDDSENLLITNTVDTLLMRIDSDTDIDGTTAPTGYFNLIGTGGQFTFDNPPVDGYQIRPSFLTEIEDRPAPQVGFVADTIMVGEADGVADIIIEFLQGNPDETSVDIAVDAANSTATDGDDYSFTAGTLTLGACGTDSLVEVINVVDDGVTETEEYVVLTLSNPTNGATLGQATLVVTIVDGTTSIEALPSDAVRMFPNPSRGVVELQAGSRIEAVQVYDLVGKQVMATQPLATDTRLNLSQLPAGLYTVTVITAQGRWTSKLIRE